MHNKVLEHSPSDCHSVPCIQKERVENHKEAWERVGRNCLSFHIIFFFTVCVEAKAICMKGKKKKQRYNVTVLTLLLERPFSWPIYPFNMLVEGSQAIVKGCNAVDGWLINPCKMEREVWAEGYLSVFSVCLPSLVHVIPLHNFHPLRYRTVVLG